MIWLANLLTLRYLDEGVSRQCTLNLHFYIYTWLQYMNKLVNYCLYTNLMHIYVNFQSIRLHKQDSSLNEVTFSLQKGWLTKYLLYSLFIRECTQLEWSNGQSIVYSFQVLKIMEFDTQSLMKSQNKRFSSCSLFSNKQSKVLIYQYISDCTN